MVAGNRDAAQMFSHIAVSTRDSHSPRCWCWWLSSGLHVASCRAPPLVQRRHLDVRGSAGNANEIIFCFGMVMVMFMVEWSRSESIIKYVKIFYYYIHKWFCHYKTLPTVEHLCLLFTVAKSFDENPCGYLYCFIRGDVLIVRTMLLFLCMLSMSVDLWT